MNACRVNLVVGLLAVGCQSAPPARQVVAPGDSVVLAPRGEVTVTVAGSTTATVRLLRIVADGRCPRGRQCVASGPVAAEFALGPAPTDTVVLEVFDRDVGEPRMQGVRSCAPVGGLVLRLRDVMPWPEGNEPVPPREYRAMVVFAPSCGGTGAGAEPMLK